MKELKTAHLGLRVRASIKTMAERRALALDLSLARYIEGLIRADATGERGKPAKPDTNGN